MKHCWKCKQDKAPAEFNRNTSTFDGLQSICRTCQLDKQREYRAKNKARHTPPGGTPVPPPPPVEEFEITVEEPPAADPLTRAYEETRKATEKRDLKREHSALMEENERLKTELAEVVRFRKPPEILVYRQPAWERSDAVAMGVASDWHVEEPVIKETVHGLNEYNLDVAKARAERFFKNLLRLTDIMARDSKITTLYLAALGDFFSGWIHEELIAGGLLAPGDAARFCKGLWFSGIDFLLRESSYVLEGDFIPGNHGRMTRQMHFGDPTGTSLESVMYDAIVDRYHDNPRVRFRVASQAMVYRRFFESFNVRLIHGYEVKYGGGVGGITIPLNKAVAQWDIAVRASLTVLGHFHQLFDGGNFLVNGSMIGYNTFAQAIKAKFEAPRQAFCLIHARNGGEKSLTGPIWLDDARHP
jgi:hypothetical protein